jgi:hemolysin activation/secretion protein
LLNGEIAGGDDRYQTYEASYRSYHQLSEPLVLAWEVQGCKKSGTVPLWDTCLVGLRGFAATDYLGTASLSGQVEARWHFWKKLGAVGFVGYGTSQSTYSEVGGNASIPSYGIGLRFMVLESKRINMRLDYARSDDSDAVYLSVAEAF